MITMTIHQILQMVHTAPKDELLFFLEGNFRKCYDHHAFYFTEKVKKMKVHTRFYKNAQTYVHSMGFPETVLHKYVAWLQQHLGAKITEQTEKYLRLSEIEWGKVSNYQVWKEHCIREEERAQQALEQQKISNEMLGWNDASQPLPKAYATMIEKIKNYPIESVTPIEAFHFLHKLKKMANECATSTIV